MKAVWHTRGVSSFKLKANGRLPVQFSYVSCCQRAAQGLPAARTCSTSAASSSHGGVPSALRKAELPGSAVAKLRHHVGVSCASAATETSTSSQDAQEGQHTSHSAEADPIAAAAAAEAAAAAAARRLAEEDDELAASFQVPAAVRERNRLLTEELRGELILAPLTRGNHAPFRQFVMEQGCRVTMSEMAFGKPLIKGDKVERMRLRRLPSEQCYGFQVATKTISEALAASKLAQEHGARWMDINCGCPIFEATRRGLGAAMLRKPRSLAKLVNAIVQESELPITVKIRLGESEKNINVQRVVKLLSAAGAAAVTIHGRTMEQRYRRPADWDTVSQVASSPGSAPIIGNGDILTLYDVQRRLQGSGCLAVMVGRGALIKPWIFREMREGRELSPSAEERVSLYRRFYSLMKSHFGDDAMGRRKAWYFAPWHHSFFHRYRRYPRDVYEQRSLQHPLILTRSGAVDPLLGEERVEDLAPLERLLRNENEAAHEAIAGALWEATSDAEAVAALLKLAQEKGPDWEAQFRASDRSGREDGDDRG